MENVTLDAYLFFDGNCREAMQFYQKAFGGELEIKPFGEADDNAPAEKKDQVMHARLSGGAVNLMASDGMEPDKLGTGKISLALSGTDEEKLRKIFNQLSKDGNIIHPLEKQFWGAIYGDFIDKYNVRWMVNISTQS